MELVREEKSEAGEFEGSRKKVTFNKSFVDCGGRQRDDAMRAGAEL